MIGGDDMSKKYYKTNLLKPFESWILNEHATATQSAITIESGGEASCQLDIDFEPNSLTQSDKRRLVLYIEDENGAIGPKQQFNYKETPDEGEHGSLAVVIGCGYVDPESEDSESTGDKDYIVLSPNTINYKKYYSDTYLYVYSFDLDMLPMNLNYMYVRIDNGTEYTVNITKATLRRSKDISQIDENTLTSIQIVGVDAYLNGMEVSFENVAQTMKCTWDGDASGLTGITINGEHHITFTRHNGLLDING